MDFPSANLRDGFRRKLLESGVIMLPCGDKSMRFRPPIDIKEEAVTEAFEIIRTVLHTIA
jgi:L-lysine 6-transaminase